MCPSTWAPPNTKSARRLTPLLPRTRERHTWVFVESTADRRRLEHDLCSCVPRAPDSRALALVALGASHPRQNPGGEVCTRNFASLERRFAPATSSHLTQRKRKPGSPEHDCALTAAPCAMAFPVSREVCTRNLTSLERRFAPATSSHLTQRTCKPGSPEHDCTLAAAPSAMASPVSREVCTRTSPALRGGLPPKLPTPDPGKVQTWLTEHDCTLAAAPPAMASPRPVGHPALVCCLARPVQRVTCPGLPLRPC